MQKIVIIFPYFGTLPPQYKMWRVSAVYNSTIDFMFFTDADVKSAKNIIVHKMTFSDFQGIAQKAFDFPITLDRPYKLCEYKQAYGLILQEYIKNYDFWGFGDLYRNISRTMISGDLETLTWSMAISAPFSQIVFWSISSF